MPLLVVSACQKAPSATTLDAGGRTVVVTEAVDAGTPAPAQKEAPRYVVKDNKVRCIQAPCMSLDAMPVNSSAATERISSVDLSALSLGNKEEEVLLSKMYGERGLEVEGEIVEEESKVGKGGMARVLKVTRVITPLP